MKSPVVLLSSYLDDVKRLEPGVKGLDRDLITIKSRFEHEGYGFFTVTLSSLCDAIDYGLAEGRFTCPTHFSKIRGKALPKFLSGLLCEVFDPNSGLLLNKPHEHFVKCLRGILRLFKKALVSQKREDKLHVQAVKGFIRTDEHILSNSFDKNKLNLLRDVSKLVLQSLHSVDLGSLPCKHGPGGVAERVRTNQKWVVLRESCHHNSFLATKYGIDIFSSNGEDLTDYQGVKSLAFDEMLYDADVINGLVPQLASSGIALLHSVPKSSTARRTITSEPTLNMYIQQGLNSVLRDSINQCRVLRSCLALTDQSKNQNLARIGSLTGKYATIDLSSASDLLDLNLVKEVFATKVPFLTALLDCRSSHVDTGNGIIELRKYAGMGNATTFPVQSIVFAILAICGVLCCDGNRPSYVNVKRAARRIRVYGDDIIIQTEYVTQVYDWLASFGLKVNQQKSFTKGNFRESCGLDAYRGTDVTPIYIKHWPVDTSGNPDLIANLVSVSNQAWLQGLYKLADVLKDMVEDFVGPLPLVSRNSASLGWHSRVDTNVAQKWDGKLQRLVFRGLVIEPLRRDDNLTDYAALAKSLHNLEQRKKSLARESESDFEALVQTRSDLQANANQQHTWFYTHGCRLAIGEGPDYSVQDSKKLELQVPHEGAPGKFLRFTGERVAKLRNNGVRVLQALGAEVVTDPQHLERTVLRFHTRLRKRWLPAQAG